MKSQAIVSGKIYTGIPGKMWVSAIYSENGRIIKLGSDTEIAALCNSQTRIIKAEGKLVTPGIIDAHCHFIYSGLAQQWVQLNNLKSLEACLEKIKEAARTIPKGNWIYGRGWNHQLWDNPQEPDKNILDQITPDHPVAMTRVCGHSIWVNSKALELAGINKNTPSPKGGAIDRDQKGDATGIIRESLDIIYDVIPDPTFSQMEKAARDAQQQALQFGITSLRSMEDLETYQVLQQLEKERALKLRICQCLPPDDIDSANRIGIRPGKGSDQLWHEQLKLFADGALGANTALMHEGYLDQPNECGLACLTVQEMKDYTEFAYDNGRSVTIHAIGDLALTNALTAIEQARKKHPGFGKDTIEHLQFFKSEDLDRMKYLGIFASVQPIFLPTDWKMALKKIGESRCENAYAWRTIIEKGIPYQFGSDNPIETNNPLAGIRAAVTRTDLEESPDNGWFPRQKLDFETCLKGYTHHAAKSLGQAHNLGDLSAGKWADLVVWDSDLTELPGSNLTDHCVDKTIVGGEIIYQNASLKKCNS